MNRKYLLSIVPALLLATPSSAQDGSLVRVEPRPYYGATITIEEGVRVFRPLPKTKTMIINPGQKTPLHINVDGRGEVSQNVTHNVRVNNRFFGRRR